jgi:hypothetical protein
VEYNGSVGLRASGDRWLLVEALHQLSQFRWLPKISRRPKKTRNTQHAPRATG